MHDDLGWSIKGTAERTSESEWTVKQKLKLGIYRARKSGRRTIIIPDSVRSHIASLPDAQFAAPRERRVKHEN